jgi:hypothetical protein
LQKTKHHPNNGGVISTMRFDKREEGATTLEEKPDIFNTAGVVELIKGARSRIQGTIGPRIFPSSHPCKRCNPKIQSIRMTAN